MKEEAIANGEFYFDSYEDFVANGPRIYKEKQMQLIVEKNQAKEEIERLQIYNQITFFSIFIFVISSLIFLQKKYNLFKYLKNF